MKTEPSSNNDTSIFGKTDELTWSAILSKLTFATFQDVQKVLPDCTYRTINHWDTSGLLDSQRENKSAGWRRFTLPDLIKILIINTLRKFGFSIATTKKVLRNLSAGLARNIYNVLIQKKKVFLTVKENGEVFYVTEAEMIQDYFIQVGVPCPLLVIPFYGYITTITELNETIHDLLQPLSVEERKIIFHFQAKDWNEMTITKTNGKGLTIRSKSVKQGDFSTEDIIKLSRAEGFQRVTFSKANGRIVSIAQEVTNKA